MIFFYNPHCGRLVDNLFISIYHSAGYNKPDQPLYTIIEFHSANPIGQFTGLADNLGLSIVSKI